MKLNALAAHRPGMTDTVTPSKPFAIGRMTATERAAGRFLRGPDDHPAAAPAGTETVIEPPVTTSVPAAAADASLIAAPAATEPTPPARPDGLPETYWDEATGAVKPEAYTRLAELEAAAAERQVPETPDAYVLELPEPVVGLDGKPVAFDADDPMVKALLPAFHKAGVPQTAFAEILQAYAASEVAAAAAEQEATTAYVAAEQTKLGANHKERTAALHGQVVAAIGAEPAEALRMQMRSADGVLALEQLVSKIQGPAMSAVPAKTPATPDIATRLYG